MISIVIPTYKRTDYLERLLKSIKAQTFKEYEIIVVDDNSPNKEDYEEVVNKYSKEFKEFTFLRNDTNKGAPYSRNRGIKKAKYEYIALVDDDDEWLPEKLKKQIEIFNNSDENLGIVYTWTDAIDEKGDIVHQYRAEIEGTPKKEILKGCFLPSPSVMVRKTHIQRVGLFDEGLPSCQDWDMWTRMILNNSECKVVKSVVTLYHKHNNGSIGLSAKAYQGFLLYFRKHFLSALKVNPVISAYYIYQYFKMRSKREV
ncbi:glycosyl transferase, family 2 [Neobacillus bataviensis LMG 21833]|uniref:Glycosyl transferase, family 2 n=1 Tax=Neobacillus bataviensis LMG 21833 TaxID=1117379 RepID=K6D1S7_9BACI|nr:glycosyltransferase family 2 protein [Neobacillus bataviensis]EKN66452.1 glycosyl transferase, family 2 [Neobacillus bataviensis LMG 21833]